MARRALFIIGAAARLIMETLRAKSPKGFEFMDEHLGRVMLVQAGPLHGWIVFWHPDGYWVSLRKATAQDLEIIGHRILLGN